MKALIKITELCNNNCLFCHNEKTGQSLDDKEILRKIELIAGSVDTILFSGGEPTMHKGLLKAFRHIRSKGIGAGLVTNARRLSDRRYAASLSKNGLSYAYVSFHSADKEIFDSITRSEGSFEQSFKGIMNLIAAGIDPIINCVVNRKNYKRLKELINLLSAAGVKKIKFSAAFISGNARKYPQIILRYSEMQRFILEASNHAKTRGVKAMIGGIPDCISGRLAKMNDNLKTHDIQWMSNIDDDDFCRTDAGDRQHTGPCIECSRSNICPGVSASYAGLYGTGELNPSYERIANSFNYFQALADPEEEEKSTKEEEKGQIQRDGQQKILTKQDRGYSHPREILVRDGGKRIIYRTHTRDFSEYEIQKITDKGQIYANLSMKKRSDDFSSSYIKLKAIDKNSNTFAYASGGLFYREELILMELLKKIRGPVLDVGCGIPRYMDIFRQNESYIGIDPDKKAKEAAERAGLDVIQADFESYYPKGAFDCILFLRSINHFRSVRAALSKARDILSGDGRIIVADNSAFGIIQDLSNMDKGDETSHRGHFHTLDSSAVISLAKEEGLAPEFSKKISQDSANQWVVVLKKAKKGGYR